MSKRRLTTTQGFSNVFEELYKQLCATGANYLDDRELVKDLVSGLILQFLELNEDLSSEEVHKQLFTALKNDCLDEVKKKTPVYQNSSSLDDLPAAEEPSPEVKQMENDLTSWALGLEDKLLPQEVDLLKYYTEGKSVKQIAMERNISTSTVY